MICLPGATALIPALVVSGLPNNEFLFAGFLPQKKGRQTKLKQLAEEKKQSFFTKVLIRSIRHWSRSKNSSEKKPK
jgi:16S rRNA C1402 (ribose-2'-O) methylase RsmI